MVSTMDWVEVEEGFKVALSCLRERVG